MARSKPALFFGVLGVLSGLSRVWADSITLNNGNRIDGIITSESPAQVVVDIGYGTVTLQKADIVKISRPSKELRRSEEMKIRLLQFQSGRWAPAPARKLAGLLKNARTARAEAFDSAARRKTLGEEMRSIEEELPGLKEDYTSLSRNARGLDPNSDPRGYNEAIARTNAISLQIRSDELRLEEIQRKMKESEAATQRYLDSYRLLQEYADGEGHRLFTLKSSEDDAPYYDWSRSEIQSMGGDFILDSIPSESRGDGLIVRAVLNGSRLARLMVDTGASMTLLYGKTAEALGLDLRSSLGSMQVTVADGRTVEALLFRLDSIAVGKSKVANSMVAVVPVELGGFDGLLGMSFLSHFSVKVDNAHHRLVLEGLSR